MAEIHSTATTTSNISADEIALYDRQIRLWGLQAQERIRNANILLINAKALGNEVAKNLVLAGIGSLTVLDNALVTDDDLGSQFLISEVDVGTSRGEAASRSLQQLNPRVKITADARDITSILAIQSDYLQVFDIVIATDMPMTFMNEVNAAARLSARPFYAAGSHGFYGFVFADLIEHTFTITRDKGNITTKIGPETATRSIISSTTRKENDKYIEQVTKHESYQPMILANTSPLPASYNNRRRLRSVTPLLPCLRALWDFERTAGRPPSHSVDDLRLFTTLATQKCAELQLPPELLKADFLRSFMQNLYGELSPVCAILGAHLAQDVINVLGKREQPVQNMMFFDGEASTAPVYALCPIVPTTNGTV